MPFYQKRTKNQRIAGVIQKLHRQKPPGRLIRVPAAFANYGKC